MKQIKSIISAFLICCIAFSLGACGKKDEPVIADRGSTTEAVTENISEDNRDNSGATTQALQTEAEKSDAQKTKPSTTASAKPTVSQVQTTKKQESEVLKGVDSYSGEYKGKEQIVYYPKNIKNSQKTYPVIVWANGTGVSYSFYKDLLKALSDGGYIVVANTETMSADGTAQIASLDFVISENENSSSVLYKKVNTQKIGAAGHSQGGRSSVNAAVADSRFDCVFSIAGSNYDYEVEKLTAPAFFTTGTGDMVVSADSWVKPAFKLCKGPAVYVSLKNGIHTSCSTKPNVYANYGIKWFDIWLKDDTAKKSVFQNGGELSKDSAWTDFKSKGI